MSELLHKKDTMVRLGELNFGDKFEYNSHTYIGVDIGIGIPAFLDLTKLDIVLISFDTIVKFIGSVKHLN